MRLMNIKFENKDGVSTTCKRCGKSSPADKFALHHAYKMVVCPACVAEYNHKTGGSSMTGQKNVPKYESFGTKSSTTSSASSSSYPTTSSSKKDSDYDDFANGADLTAFASRATANSLSKGATIPNMKGSSSGSKPNSGSTTFGSKANLSQSSSPKSSLGSSSPSPKTSFGSPSPGSKLSSTPASSKSSFGTSSSGSRLNSSSSYSNMSSQKPASVEKNTPADWDSDDKYLEKVKKKTDITKPVIQQIDEARVKYTCLKCKYTFVYNTFKEYPKTCPYCRTAVAKF